MTAIRPLTTLTLDELQRVASGYVSEQKYDVAHTETDDEITFSIKLIQLEQPYLKEYSFDLETLGSYTAHLANGFCFGVYEDGDLAGLAVSEVHKWNNSLQIHDFHVAEEFRGRGLGRQLMERVVSAARDAGLRLVVCETQNKNVPAIKFYKRLGFSLEGLDLTHYRNTDYPDGEIAVFMKLRLT
jgi:ribosomal protein S18 acetylase RimI-like enzyme